MLLFFDLHPMDADADNGVDMDPGDDDLVWSPWWAERLSLHVIIEQKKKNR